MKRLALTWVLIVSAQLLALAQSHTPDDHLTMGNPSNAVTDANVPNNYLLFKDQYAVGYSRDNGEANWISAHLDSSWLGSAPRQNDFRADTTLPAGWYEVQSTDYSGSGFDRDLQCPSADRTDTIPDNSATFLMTNMLPTAPDAAQGPLESLESTRRTWVGQGYEVYYIAGGYGQGGTGSAGGTTNTVAGGHVKVPSNIWRVVMVMPAGSNDVARVTTTTRVIGFVFPNAQGIRGDDPANYRVSVDQIEAATGLDFFSNVPPVIQSAIESRVDTGPLTMPNLTTAANVGISGRVVDSAGRVVRNVSVRLTGSDGTARTAMTNAFGYYSFDSVSTGGSYVVSARARGMSFSPRVVNLTGSLTNLDIVELP